MPTTETTNARCSCGCTTCRSQHGEANPQSANATLPEPVQLILKSGTAFALNPDRAQGFGDIQFIARPGEPLNASPEPGDILIRIIEGGSRQAAIVASSGLWRGHELRGRGLHPDTDAAEGYLHVTEHAPLRHEISEGFARGVTDRGGRLLEDLLLLRLVTPEPTIINPSPTVIAVPQVTLPADSPVVVATEDGNESDDSASSRPQEDDLSCHHIDASRLTWDGASAAQLEFKRSVYLRQVRAACQVRQFVADVPSSELGMIEDGMLARTAAARACRSLLASARAAMTSDPAAARVSQIGVASGYRSASHQFDNWSRVFPQYYAQTQADRAAAPGGEDGAAAAALLTRYISRRLAAAGFSLHNDGRAIDFHTVEAGHSMGPSTAASNLTHWRASWFFSWLSANANGLGFFQNTSIDEPWHWEYRGLAGASSERLSNFAEVYDIEDTSLPESLPEPDTVEPTGLGESDGAFAAETTIAAGRLPLSNVPLLAQHRGTQPDLILRWNDMTDAAAVDIVIHLHGYSGQGLAMSLRNKELYSGLDFWNPAQAAGQQPGRSAPTLGIVPRGSYTGDAVNANPARYTFPALRGSTAIADLITYSLSQFQAATGGPGNSSGRLILTAHSGGGAALMSILANNNPNEIQVFDALYDSPTALIRWVNDRISSEILSWTAGKTHADGGLCVLCRREGTLKNSLKVRDAIQTAIAGAPADAQPVLRAAYRVLVTNVSHGEIPRRFGWRLLTDIASASVASAAVANQASEDIAERTPAATPAPLPKGSACAYFFKGTRYLRYNIAADMNDFGPATIATYWNGMPTDFQQNLGASVNWGDGHAYFFKDSRYVRYNIATDRVDRGPVAIAGNWPKLPADFQSDIGAAVNWGDGHAYFFKGQRYLRYDIGADVVDVGPTEISRNWPGLPAEFQRDLDGVVNWGDGRAYFFKGARYVRYVLATDTVDVGPAEISRFWPNLPAGFQAGLQAPINWTYPVDLAEFMRAAGLNVEEIGNWRTLHSPGALTPIGVMMHHTAGTDSLDVVVKGDRTLSGPRCNFLIDKAGTVKVISGGHANHAGKGSRQVLDETNAGTAPSGTAASRSLRDTVGGNGFFYGFENENRGDGVDPWPEVQLDAMARAAAALCHLHGWNADASHVIAHKEWTSRKIDPNFDMNDFRARVARLM